MPAVGFQAVRGGLLQQADDLLDRIAVSADDQVNVLRQDAACVYLVPALCHLVPETVSDAQCLVAVEHDFRAGECEFRRKTGGAVVGAVGDGAARVGHQRRGAERFEIVRADLL